MKNPRFVMVSLLVMAAPLLAGCTYSEVDFTPIEGGQVTDRVHTVSQVREWYNPGRTTTNSERQEVQVGARNCHSDVFRWSVELENVHGNNARYGAPANLSLVEKLQQWKDSKELLRLFVIRHRNVGCDFVNNDVIYCAEPTKLDVAQSRVDGCLAQLKTQFPGVVF